MCSIESRETRPFFLLLRYLQCLSGFVRPCLRGFHVVKQDIRKRQNGIRKG